MIGIVLFCLPFFAFSADDKMPFHRAEAQDGDGVLSLLRRHQLAHYQCNVNKFYEINKLRESSVIVKGRTYLLPIFIYKYDGKSIRTTIGSSDWNKAVRIQTFNNDLTAANIRAESYAKSRVLWVPYHELHCEKEVQRRLKSQSSIAKAAIPTPKEKAKEEVVPLNVQKAPGNTLANQAAKKGHYPIFGDKYATTPIVSNKLQGKVYYIVGGHGGPDPGAVGYRGNHRLCEDEYAYDVALRLCRNLIMHGATAYMIVRDPNDGIRSGQYLNCDKDEVVWGDKPIPRSQKTRLTQRSDAINEIYKRNKWSGVTDQTIIVVHVDSRADKQIDLFFYHHPRDARGKAIAKNLQSTMRSKYKTYQASRNYFGTVTGRDLHMLREVEAPAIYIELGNIKHDRDQQRIVLERNRQLIADWLLEGLLKE